jgi:hypothetical protein
MLVTPLHLFLFLFLIKERKAGPKLYVYSKYHKYGLYTLTATIDFRCLTNFDRKKYALTLIGMSYKSKNNAHL